DYPPTPTGDYVLPPPAAPAPLTDEQVLEIQRIRRYIRHFRNLLGLHCIVTCAQHALWYHLSKFLVDGNMRSINVEDWELFLMDCNTTGELLGWDSKRKIVTSLRSGWASNDPDPLEPLPRPTWQPPTLEGNELLHTIFLLRRFILLNGRLGPSETASTWFDITAITFHFNSMGPPAPITAENMVSMLLTYFDCCFTTGPPGCIGWCGPTYVRKMALNIYTQCEALRETTDVGTMMPVQNVRSSVEYAFEGDGEREDPQVENLRMLRGEDDSWWLRCVLQLLPAFFS
ncbi:hypothetical protein V495_08025, partial [Pseudogymnoascus sp. VKM F-4514 (FW-929)]